MSELVPGVHVPGDPEPESRFTWSTDLCPHPEYWHSTDGDSTEVEVSDLIYGLVRGLQPDYCVETGSAFGQTTEQIALALKVNGHGFLDSIEADADRARDSSQRCFAAGVGEYVHVHYMDSMAWAPMTGLTVDFAFFDSLYELRVPEFLRYRQWMRRGTIAAFHDSAPEHGSHRIDSGNDLRTEIEERLSDQLRIVHFPTPRGITITEVR